MKIVDDFLDQKEFDNLQAFMMGLKFSWNYNSTIDYSDDLNKFQFVHVFYDRFKNKNNERDMDFFKALNPIIQTMQSKSLCRIKANLLTRTPEIVENIFHTDYIESEIKLNELTTSIFYMNTNNGYTKFEDGTKVESVANRFVTFPSNLKHTGTSCTDEKTRVVINFNYFSNRKP